MRIKEILMYVEGLYYSSFSEEDIAKMGSREFNVSQEYIKQVYNDFKKYK